MIIVSAKIIAKNGDRDKIISKAQDVIKYTRQEPGCISHDLYASTEDENVLIMFEKWKNQDELNSHMQTEHFKAFGKSIEEFVAEDLEVDVYSVEGFD